MFACLWVFFTIVPLGHRSRIAPHLSCGVVGVGVTSLSLGRLRGQPASLTHRAISSISPIQAAEDEVEVEEEARRFEIDTEEEKEANNGVSRRGPAAQREDGPHHGASTDGIALDPSEKKKEEEGHFGGEHDQRPSRRLDGGVGCASPNAVSFLLLFLPRLLSSSSSSAIRFRVLSGPPDKREEAGTAVRPWQ